MRLAKLATYTKWLIAGVFLLVGAMVAWIVIREWDALIAFPWRFNPLYFVLLIVFHSLALGVTFVVWQSMMARLGHFDHVGLNFRFYYLSTLAKRIPTVIWYVGGRVALYQQVGVSAAKVLNCILLENMIVGLAGVLVFLMFLPWYSLMRQQLVVPIAVVGVVGVSVVLARPQLFVEITNWLLNRLGKRPIQEVPQRKDVIIWGVLYTLPWFFAGFALYAATRAFSDHVTLGIVDAIGISTLAMLVALVSSLLPGGLGLKELTSSVLLSSWMPFASAVVISVAYRLIQTMNEMGWALLATWIVPGVRDETLKH
jgi:uncharacterized membrane protein YbhN (UPF0104 family)